MANLEATIEQGESAVRGYLVGIHPLIILLLGVVIGLALLGLISWIITERRKRDQSQYLTRMTSVFMTERLRSEAILQNLDLGVLAFTPDGQLNLANDASTRLLGRRSPDKLSDLLDQWPQLADVRAALVLGSEEAEATIDSLGGRVNMQFRIAKPEGSRLATIVVLRDVTMEEREEHQRKEFVANVSHELKTPITTIMSFTESLLEWGLSEKEIDRVRDDLQRINDDAHRMNKLVSDLLLLSSLDSQGKRMVMEDVDLNLLSKQIVERLSQSAVDEGISLTFKPTGKRMPPIFAEYSSIERILSNLLTNAIKYVGKDGHVTLETDTVLDEVRIVVSDDGVGIDRNHLPYIFDRFYRVDSTGSRRHGGTGLGLSIALELVSLHHGTLEVDSTVGRGTTFTIVLPTAERVYNEVWQQVAEYHRPLTDLLMREAGDELVKQAADYGYYVDDLRDLSKEELVQVLAPYRALDR